MNPKVPHFDLPFRIQGDHFAAVEQDTLREIQNCVEVIIRSAPGDRESQPDFGSVDLTFDAQPVSPELLLDAIREWEPRAVMLAEEYPDDFDQLVDHISAQVVTELND